MLVFIFYEEIFVEILLLLFHYRNDSTVLNDIDYMLSDLNKQLDAMLEFEKGFNGTNNITTTVNTN